MTTTLRTAGALALLMSSSLAHAERQTATGVVFHDLNENGIRDAGEPGVGGVFVSNGYEVVRTDGSGAYELQVDDDEIIFVCKPQGWMVARDENNLPRHYYIHKPNGSPDLKYGGVAPTGPLPASIDFPLTLVEESRRFNVVLFGDPQPYSIEQVDHLKNDIVPEVIDFVREEGAAFGVTLGDIVGDDLELFHPLNDAIAAVGIPWLNVYGNHDMDFDTPGDEYADETFNRVYGPTTYAYQVGWTHFIVMDNVIYEGPTEERPMGPYRAGLTNEQRAFIRNYVKLAREYGGTALQNQARFVLLMHIPAVEFDDLREEVFGSADYSMFQRTHPVSLAAHWHRNHTFFMEVGEDTHHHVVCHTTSGSWWSGQADEYATPHTMMRDGKPNGWLVLTMDDALAYGYELRFKAAGKPWSEQMHIHAPESVRAGADGAQRVTVNLWSGTELSKAEIRYVHAQSGDATAWRPMRTTRAVDPYWARLKELEERGEAPKMTSLNAETLLWIDDMPGNLRPGAYTIEVRETNMYGRVYRARRIVRVEGE